MISTKLDRDMETNRFDAARARRSLEESLEEFERLPHRVVPAFGLPGPDCRR